MKYFIATVLVVFIMSFFVFNIMAQNNSENDLKPVDLSETGIPDKNQDVDSVGVMPAGESYDENSGLPNVTESDASMELN